MLEHGGQPAVALLAAVGHIFHAGQAAESSAAEQVPHTGAHPEKRSGAGIVQKIPPQAVPGKGNTNLMLNHGESSFWGRVSSGE